MLLVLSATTADVPLVACPPNHPGFGVKLGAATPLVDATKWQPESDATRMGLKLFASAWTRREQAVAQKLFVEMHLLDDKGNIPEAKAKYMSMVNFTDFSLVLLLPV
mmetsp:Transcript_30877/g.57802  ORF Transcript_30877/g.57802 Transcript_30877/m.57802 type:complete len:107 (-) Transcript_30877:316-636(-)